MVENRGRRWWWWLGASQGRKRRKAYPSSDALPRPAPPRPPANTIPRGPTVSVAVGREPAGALVVVQLARRALEALATNAVDALGVAHALPALAAPPRALIQRHRVRHKIPVAVAVPACVLHALLNLQWRPAADPCAGRLMRHVEPLELRHGWVAGVVDGGVLLILWPVLVQEAPALADLLGQLVRAVLLVSARGFGGSGGGAVGRAAPGGGGREGR